jgi:vacuolar-type H+-ATPase subunit E/Vma4
VTTDQDSSEKLRAEIFADARRRGEEIVIRAREEAEVFLTRAATEADRVRQELLGQARAEADRRSALILATVPVETGRMRAEHVEALFESVHKEVSQRLLDHEGFDYREAVIALATHAIRQMAGNTFVVKLTDSDKTYLGEGLVEEIEHRVGRPVSIRFSYGQDISGGGVVVEDGEARQVWDNSLLTRLERMWPELRRQLAVQANLVPQKSVTGDAP